MSRDSGYLASIRRRRRQGLVPVDGEDAFSGGNWLRGGRDVGTAGDAEREHRWIAAGEGGVMVSRDVSRPDGRRGLNYVQVKSDYTSRKRNWGEGRCVKPPPHGDVGEGGGGGDLRPMQHVDGGGPGVDEIKNVCRERY